VLYVGAPKLKVDDSLVDESRENEHCQRIISYTIHFINPS